MTALGDAISLPREQKTQRATSLFTIPAWDCVADVAILREGWQYPTIIRSYAGTFPHRWRDDAQTMTQSIVIQGEL